MSLKFDIEKLENIKTECEAAKDQLTKLDTELSKSLEELKNQWKTPAGKKFFDDLDEDWSKQVQQYTKITGAIVKLLDKALESYRPVEEEADSISI